MTTALIIASILQRTISIYLLLLTARILLSWFPNMDWSNPILRTLSQMTDPYLNIFRNIIPPLGGLDFSPILAFILLRVLMGAIYPMFFSIGRLFSMVAF